VALLHRTLDELVAYPPHEPRRASSTYRTTHHHLIYELDAPCWTCGIRRSQGAQLETHHAHFEWASQFGLDLAKVTADWPEITDRESLAKWVDGEGNMLVLCATHHRAQHEGIHMISYPAWLLQRYQGDGWTFIEQQGQAHVDVTAHTPLLG
jgi:hypothetical protein